MNFEDPLRGKSLDIQKLAELIRPGIAAIEYKGERFTGSGHNEAWRAFERKHQGIRLDDFEKIPYAGFVTTRDRFVSRKEALDIVRRNRQLIEESEYTKIGILRSEDRLKHPEEIWQVSIPTSKPDTK